MQLTFALILSLVGKVCKFDEFVKSGDYSRSGLFCGTTNFMELAGKRIGIIGMGTIGSKVAHVAEAFGMEVAYYSTSGTSHCKDYPSLPLDELLATSDIVSIHAPLNERTLNLIDEKELALMKPTAFIVNVGRGGIVNETALAKAIDAGTIAGAGADVFTKEPLPADNPLMNCKNSDAPLLMPHIGWASREAKERLIAGVADNISKWLNCRN